MQRNGLFTQLAINSGEDKGILSSRDRKKDIVYRRKRFNMLKYVQNRIIEKTYQRKRTNKKKRGATKVDTPIIEKGLRRSPRMLELTDGHRNAQLPNDADVLL
ncbi:hypothetical protein PR202_ga22827 [Eleusine coracana subsp. coracana]|uniref:Uncharacterized protein n=1 Tax=Eleusine coracana subsp. coracana TaxID=191504 RepID=A0AAV5D509_ELECO|nr:hypothetical protein PR202_ga22827 [Eleusine coracana subsp. coracana]